MITVVFVLFVLYVLATIWDSRNLHEKLDALENKLRALEADSRAFGKRTSLHEDRRN